MTKFKLTDFFKAGYKSEIKDETLKWINSDITKFQKESENKTRSEYAKELECNFSEMKIIHDYFVRMKFARIESHLRTIKIIIVLTFVLSIIGAIIMALGVSIL